MPRETSHSLSLHKVRAGHLSCEGAHALFVSRPPSFGVNLFLCEGGGDSARQFPPPHPCTISLLPLPDFPGLASRTTRRKCKARRCTRPRTWTTAGISRRPNTTRCTRRRVPRSKSPCRRISKIDSCTVPVANSCTRLALSMREREMSVVIGASRIGAIGGGSG